MTHMEPAYHYLWQKQVVNKNQNNTPNKETYWKYQHNVPEENQYEAIKPCNILYIKEVK